MRSRLGVRRDAIEDEISRKSRESMVARVLLVFRSRMTTCKPNEESKGIEKVL